MSSGWFGKTANMEKEVFFCFADNSRSSASFFINFPFCRKTFCPLSLFFGANMRKAGLPNFMIIRDVRFFPAQFFPWILSVALVRETEGGFYLKKRLRLRFLLFLLRPRWSVGPSSTSFSQQKKNWRCPGQSLATPIFCVILISSRSALNLLQCHEACQLGCHTWYSFESSFSVFSRSYHLESKSDDSREKWATP